MNVIQRLEKLGYQIHSRAYTRQTDGEFNVITDVEGALPDDDTLRFYFGVYPSLRHFEAGEMPGDSGISAFEIVQGEPPLLKMKLAQGGPAVAELVWQINEGLVIPAIPQVAKHFCMNLREAVDISTMGRIIYANSVAPKECPTRRFTDSDQHMMDAFSDLTGEDPDRKDGLIERIWNEAWALARVWEFNHHRITGERML